jgi:acetoin utilization deacetylase AcuC-like enzyme
MTLTVWSSSRYTFPLPEGHRFPVAKYAMLREAVIAEGSSPPSACSIPPRAGDDALALVHTPEYVRRFRDGALDAAELAAARLPWSPALVERSYRAVGGTIERAARARARLAMNLAGGTHHAFPDHGEGFCVFNDVAVAIRLLRRDGLVRRVAVVDLDVHQGNGTHAIFAGDGDVYTFSMHGGRTIPSTRSRARWTSSSPTALATTLPRRARRGASARARRVRPRPRRLHRRRRSPRGRPARPARAHLRRPRAPRRVRARQLPRGRIPVAITIGGGYGGASRTPSPRTRAPCGSRARAAR